VLPLAVEDGPQGSGAELRIVLRQAAAGRLPDVFLNGHPVPLQIVDDEWCDPQIYGDRPQPSAGAWTFYTRPNPERDLLLLAGAAVPSWLRRGGKRPT
jgi:hypothetical protein